MGTAAPEDADLRRRIEKHLEHLPVLPTALGRLMSLSPDDDDYFDRVLEIIEAEPNFAARILIAANSAESSPVNPISTLASAVARIGSKGATNLVLALSVAKVFVPTDPWEKSLLRHGVQVAHAARALAAHGVDDAVDGDEAYAAALLHDIGRFVMFQEAPDQLRAVDEGDWDTPQALVEQEQAICGLTHPELGAMACTKWRLPEIIREVVRRHHEPVADGYPDAASRLTAVVRVADFAMFPSVMPGTPGLETEDEATIEQRLRPKIPPFLDVPVARLKQIVTTAAAESEAACSALGV